MKKLYPYIILLGILIWVFLLSIPLGSLPPLGNFLNPSQGFWANAKVPEATSITFRPKTKDSILARTLIVLDDRLVPHIKANSDYDLYYAQGYVQAYYRLWQMEMQVRAAGGMLSEVVGESALSYDRHQRRKGMLWGAEKSLETILQNPQSKTIVTAYTAGVNAYIKSLSYKDYPIEYKLMNFSPQKWEPLNCALIIKLMADDLTGASRDLARSYLLSYLGKEKMDFLFPDKLTTSASVIPKGTPFARPALTQPRQPAASLTHSPLAVPSDSNLSQASELIENNNGIGSNNWVVDGTKTESGYPILANDPHLGLSLPSIWYETQLSGPQINCYGVSIPGAPGIVIGFNDQISWGLTNNYRDVKDYYALKVDQQRKAYYFDHQWLPFKSRFESIKVKGHSDSFVDTVHYTVHGPVEYDETFPAPGQVDLTLAMSWMGHEGSNEVLSVSLLNRAKNYEEFTAAIKWFHCPAQNIIYADTAGNIAIWGQGQFINKWKEQGKYLMRGDTSATLWGEPIPTQDNPHILNPSQHFLQSANQQVTDASYPYYYNGNFSEIRSWAIEHFLKKEQKFTPELMMALQNNNWLWTSSKLYPYFKKYQDTLVQTYPDYAQDWGGYLMADSKTGLSYQIWWSLLYNITWEDLFKGLPLKIYPSPERTIELLTENPTVITQLIGKTVPEIMQQSMRLTIDSLGRLFSNHHQLWYQVKNTSIPHMAKLKPFGYYHLKTGGSGQAINAMKEQHGPSWRMVVEMQPGGIKAFCNYPGGPSGNPASPHYSSFLSHWIEGKYYPIHFFKEDNYAQFARNPS